MIEQTTYTTDVVNQYSNGLKYSDIKDVVWVLLSEHKEICKSKDDALDLMGDLTEIERKKHSSELVRIQEAVRSLEKYNDSLSMRFFKSSKYKEFRNIVFGEVNTDEQKK